MRNPAMTVVAVDRGVVGERNPETASERVDDQVANTGRRKD